VSGEDTPRRIAQGVAHDFHHIIGLIRNNVKFLTSRDLPESALANHYVQEDFESIREALDQGERLSWALQQYSQASEPDPTIFNVNDMIHENKALLSSLSAITINYSLADDLYPIKADRTQIERVMWNLIINARDALGASGGEIEISTENYVSVERASLYVCLTVTDDGPGIPEEQQKRIFEPFFTTKTGNGDGSAGLGLPTVQGIVLRAGGEIVVESEEGRTSFTVQLPAGVLGGGA
jgi:two-component system cell cycle sensor histidine kinase/response regulator CckA